MSRTSLGTVARDGGRFQGRQVRRPRQRSIKDVRLIRPQLISTGLKGGRSVHPIIDYYINVTGRPGRLV